MTVTSSERKIKEPWESQQTPLEWQSKHLLWLFTFLAATYILFALVRALEQPLSDNQHFIYLADGWLHGHLYLNSVPPDTGDYTLYNGHWYVAFPPLPAVFLLPVVAIFHLAYAGIISLIFAVGMGVLNIWLMLRVLRRFAQQQYIGQKFVAVAWLGILFALGTEHLYATMQGNVWYTAHIVATTFLLLYIDETLDKRRPVLAACYLGLATLTRSTALFTFPFFALLALAAYVARKREGKPGAQFELWRQLLLFFAVLALFVAALLVYNQVRFGSLLDFGYSTMNVNPFVRGNLHRYGQFSLHFVRTNLRYMLLEPPLWAAHAPYLSFTPLGTGIFWTTPALLFALLTFRKRERWAMALALLAACLLPVALLAMYFNTGWYQFGYRFILDFLPFALLLAALGMRELPGWREKAVILLSVAVNVWGFIAFTFFHP